MRLAVLILALVMALFAGMQSSTISTLGRLTGDSDIQGSGAVGMLLALLALLAAAFVMNYPRNAAWLLLAAAGLGMFAGYNSRYTDLIVWGVGALALSAMAFRGQQELAPPRAWRSPRHERHEEIDRRPIARELIHPTSDDRLQRLPAPIEAEWEEIERPRNWWGIAIGIPAILLVLFMLGTSIGGNMGSAPANVTGSSEQDAEGLPDTVSQAIPATARSAVQTPAADTVRPMICTGYYAYVPRDFTKEVGVSVRVADGKLEWLASDYGEVSGAYVRTVADGSGIQMVDATHGSITSYELHCLSDGTAKLRTASPSGLDGAATQDLTLRRASGDIFDVAARRGVDIVESE